MRPGIRVLDKIVQENIQLYTCIYLLLQTLIIDIIFHKYMKKTI